MRPDKYAAPVVNAYSACVDRLLENIAKHFNVNALDSTPSTQWQVKKLAEMGALNRESIQIIMQTIGSADAMTRTALEQYLLDSIAQIDPALAKAAAQGLLPMAPATTMTPAMTNIWTYYSGQAVNQLNLVNTVMLNSSLAQYAKMVNNIASLEQYGEQIRKAQEILNATTGEVVTGISSRQSALRSAVKQLADEGLTGFTDAAGKTWSPEAYVNMDIRTTAGNVATKAVMARNEEYGNDLIWVRSKANARPLCYPYQGKVFSTSGRSGTVTDLDDNVIRFEPLGSTSYGQPAGLFGINCGHVPPNPFIPSMSMVRGEPVGKAENDKAYQLTQTQRYLERNVKAAKREAVMSNATGDKEAFRLAAKKAKENNAKLREYTEANGLTYRPDRTQVYGFDKSVSAKATQAIKPAPTR